ncbi:hypothetical protein SAMD00023353_7000360 [Rosellinia necatrix]|uniref:Uncharacterized protein n=1 Tax=Rosellinia necatrix TaxID=77044 RepID=A0A1S8AAZ0_ROSNE|nr:hypothetical protein SAMD00023353_7000360 [Rosellinia necatrix]
MPTVPGKIACANVAPAPDPKSPSRQLSAFVTTSILACLHSRQLQAIAHRQDPGAYTEV